MRKKVYVSMLRYVPCRTMSEWLLSFIQWCDLWTVEDLWLRRIIVDPPWYLLFTWWNQMLSWKCLSWNEVDWFMSSCLVVLQSAFFFGLKQWFIFVVWPKFFTKESNFWIWICCSYNQIEYFVCQNFWLIWIFEFMFSRLLFKCLIFLYQQKWKFLHSTRRTRTRKTGLFLKMSWLFLKLS